MWKFGCRKHRRNTEGNIFLPEFLSSVKEKAAHAKETKLCAVRQERRSTVRRQSVSGILRCNDACCVPMAAKMDDDSAVLMIYYAWFQACQKRRHVSDAATIKRPALLGVACSCRIDMWGFIRSLSSASRNDRRYRTTTYSWGINLFVTLMKFSLFLYHYTTTASQTVVNSEGTLNCNDEKETKNKWPNKKRQFKLKHIPFCKKIIVFYMDLGQWRIIASEFI